MGIIDSLLTLLLIWKIGLKWYIAMEAPLNNAILTQDSVLGPLLFLIHINNISDNIQSSVSLFADDTTLYFSSKFPSHLHLDLSEDLITLATWSDTWGDSFNAQKTNALITSSSRGEHPPLIFKNMQLQEVDSHKHLGLLLHNNLSWHSHVLSLHLCDILNVLDLFQIWCLDLLFFRFTTHFFSSNF